MGGGIYGGLHPMLIYAALQGWMLDYAWLVAPACASLHELFFRDLFFYLISPIFPL